MIARAAKNWWTNMRPYYAHAYQELWVGVGVIWLAYAKMSSSASKKAIKDKGHH